MSYHADYIAILMATYNGEKYIAQQLDSVIAQSYTDWEIFIHDDASSDNTFAIIRKYSEEYPEKIHIIDAPPCGGAKNNFFYLMAEISSPYVMLCDQDDIWLPDRVERFLHAMKALEEKNGRDVPLLVFSDSTVVDSELHVMDRSFMHYQHLYPNRLNFREIMVQNVVSGNASMFNLPLVKAAVQYTDLQSVIIHDWWCALTASYFGAIAYIPESTVLYRQHGKNSIGAKKLHGFKAVFSYVGHLRAGKASLNAIRVQTGEFVNAFHLGDDSLPARYFRAGEMNRTRRMIFYFSNGIRKDGLIRNIGFYLFG